MGDGNVRHHLNALSGVFRRAASEGYVPPGYNPVAALLEKPTGKPGEARWLEVPDAALLLEAARTYTAPVEGTPFAYPLIATFLLTGARETEVYGLELDDVSLERRTITYRENAWRRLKTRGSQRIVPLWPQLETILRDYLRGPHRPTGELLFPSLVTSREGMLTDSRKLLDHVGARAGWKRGEIRSKMFRHTYAATSLQTLDGGAPVSIYTVQPRARPHVAGDGAACLCALGDDPAPIGVRRVPGRAARRHAGRAARGAAATPPVTTIVTTCRTAKRPAAGSACGVRVGHGR